MIGRTYRKCSLEAAAREGFTRHDTDQGAEDVGRSDVNETFLMHGIPKQVLHDVLMNGLDERYAGANKGTLFGAGSYFAQDIEKVSSCRPLCPCTP